MGDDDARRRGLVAHGDEPLIGTLDVRESLPERVRRERRIDVERRPAPGDELQQLRTDDVVAAAAEEQHVRAIHLEIVAEIRELGAARHLQQLVRETFPYAVSFSQSFSGASIASASPPSLPTNTGSSM